MTAPQQLRFSVLVSDGVESATAFVDVNVRDNVNELPQVDAGPNQSVDAGVLVQLSGSAIEPNSEPMVFAWVQRGGPTVSLSQADVLAPTFTAPAQGGVVVLELSATDSRLGVGVGSVTIDVLPPPVIDAGAGAGDAGAGSDGGAVDAGEPDAGELADAGGVDGGPVDAGESDAGGTPGSGLDGGDDADAGAPQQRWVLSVGCTSTGVAPFMIFLLAALRRRQTPRTVG